VLATPDLAATAARIHDTTGITPSPGGRHLGVGTRNMLCSLGPTSYLEVIGPDPEQPDPGVPRPFGIDDLREAAMVAWAIAVSDIDAFVATATASGYDPGPVEGMRRERPDGVVLAWRLTRPASTVVPFLIDWADSPHPAADAAPGLVLADLRGRHPDPIAATADLDALGIAMGVERGPHALLVELHGPLGSISFP
jgi:hypothetical protein